MIRTVALTTIGLSFGGLLLHLSGQNSAEEAPYVATIKTSFYHVDLSDREVLRNENTRVRARDRRGRTLDGPGSDDPEQVKESIIYDKPTGKRYAVNHHRRIVRLLNERSPLAALDVPDLSERQQQQTGMSSAIIRDVPCMRAPVRGLGPGGRIQEIGWSCVSRELGLLKVASDTRVSYGAETLRIVSALASIEMPADPNPDWFRVPPDYRMVQEREN